MDVVNVEIANLDDLKKRFVEICATINRPGMEDLMAWLERSDFYTAPASTRFHGNYTGGLLEHSMTSSPGLWLAILNWRSHRRRWRSLRCSTI